jgi:hypothetical protein
MNIEKEYFEIHVDGEADYPGLVDVTSEMSLYYPEHGIFMEGIVVLKYSMLDFYIENHLKEKHGEAE